MSGMPCRHTARILTRPNPSQPDICPFQQRRGTVSIPILGEEEGTGQRAVTNYVCSCMMIAGILARMSRHKGKASAAGAPQIAPAPFCGDACNTQR